MKPVAEHAPFQPTQAPNEQQALLRACALYSMNDLLYRDGLISIEKKQRVAQEIWKKYHV